ncbi:MAG: hypothetical protein NWE89_14790 [Candidatus Bathyarchaeota archaeon]|nr:hypothetical protein [Candidatus Bathyarchaeota archaeon]
MHADKALFNGKIITVDPENSVREADAIKGKRILALGTDMEIKKHVDPNTEVIDLEGKSVTPGLVDRSP